MDKEEQTSYVVLNEMEAARYIGMSVSFLRKARSEGAVGNRTRGPPYIKIGRSVRYRISSLEDFLAANSSDQTCCP